MGSPEHSLFVDAWIREAQEASKLVEDIERRIKNNELFSQEHRLRDFAQSKLIEAGVKLDRLETLLHNPPSKPILTEEDKEFRRKMLSDFQLRTRTLAFSLYSSPSAKGLEVPDAYTNKTSITIDIYEQDQMKPLISKNGQELQKSLVPDNAIQGGDQINQASSSISMALLRKVCLTIFLILGAAALLFILIILCAII